VIYYRVEFARCELNKSRGAEDGRDTGKGKGKSHGRAGRDEGRTMAIIGHLPGEVRAQILSAVELLLDPHYGPLVDQLLEEHAMAQSNQWRGRDNGRARYVLAPY